MLSSQVAELVRLPYARMPFAPFPEALLPRITPAVQLASSQKTAQPALADKVLFVSVGVSPGRTQGPGSGNWRSSSR